MGGQVILWLRHRAIHDIVKLSRPHHYFEGITLVVTQMLCVDLNFCRDISFFVATSPLFFLQYGLSYDINFSRDLNLCRDISFCHDLVCTCPKFDDQTAFHSLSIHKFSASIKSFPQSNSNIYSIKFSHNLCREKHTPLFQVVPSCELLELYWSLFLLA